MSEQLSKNIDKVTKGTVDNDTAYISLKLSDSDGNQDEQARIEWSAPTVLNGATQDGKIIFSVLRNNVLTGYLAIDDNTGLINTYTTIAPQSHIIPTIDNNSELGSAVLRFRKLFISETIQNDVVTGTAPLTVSSTTMVANLNADLLDGYEASDLLGGDAIVQRSLTASLTLADGECMIASEYIQSNAFDIELNGDSVLHIL